MKKMHSNFKCKKLIDFKKTISLRNWVTYYQIGGPQLDFMNIVRLGSHGRTARALVTSYLGVSCLLCNILNTSPLSRPPDSLTPTPESCHQRRHLILSYLQRRLTSGSQQRTMKALDGCYNILGISPSSRIRIVEHSSFTFFIWYQKSGPNHLR